MHDTALDAMAHLLLTDDWHDKSVLDVGSLDINGSYRSMVELLGAHYTGIDLASGQNVDVVTDDPYHYPFMADSFDAVICGNTLHLVEYPWLLLPELARMLKSGGLLAIVTVWQWGEHSPQDRWRFMPGGLTTLFAMTGCFEERVQMKRYEDGTLAGSTRKR